MTIAVAIVGVVLKYLDPAYGISLEDAIERALACEPSIRAARTDVDVALGRRAQADLRPNPTIIFWRQVEPGGQDDQTRIEIEWPLDLFRKAGRVSVAEREVEAVRNYTADRERLLAAEVRIRYGEVAAAVRDLIVTEELVAAVSRQHDLVRARVDEGASPPLERDLLKVELQRLESQRLRETGSVEGALIELKRILGISPETPLELKDTLDRLVERELAAPLPRDLEAASRRPDVRAAESGVMVAEALVDRAGRDGRFDVYLFGMYMRMDAGFPQRGLGQGGELEPIRGQFDYVAGGVSVTVPLRNRNQGEVAAAEAERAGASARLEAARLDAEAEIASARARDEHARRAVDVYTTEARELARRNLDVVVETYELGGATVFDVLAEERRFLDLERAYTDALREAYEARQALRRALGEVR